jgi:hypothetical protein
MTPVCDCAEKINALFALFKKQGGHEELFLAYQLTHNAPRAALVAIPIIETRKDTGRSYTRGKTRLTPNYCPFCGKKYKERRRASQKRVSRAPRAAGRPPRAT